MTAVHSIALNNRLSECTVDFVAGTVSKVLGPQQLHVIALWTALAAALACSGIVGV
jgi:hypothetical protein